MHLPDETRLTFKLRQAHTKFAEFSSDEKRKSLLSKIYRKFLKKYMKRIQEQVPL